MTAPVPTGNVVHLPTPRSLAALDVARLADSRAYARGVAALRAGRVTIDQRQALTVAATVRDSGRHTVRLAFGRHGLDHSCSCPTGTAGSFCTHLVAVALTLADSTASSEDSDESPGSASDGRSWEAQAAGVLDAAESLLASGRADDVLAFCERAVACLEDGASEIADDEALGRLAERLVRLRRRARREIVAMDIMSM
ncbi:MAG: SWIM zinc finger family protein [Ilumatobacteraceae bacterium]